MKQTFRLGLIFFLLVLMIAPGKFVRAAEFPPESIAGLKETAEAARDFARSLPEKLRGGLSGTALNMVAIADRWDRVEAMLGGLTGDGDAFRGLAPKIPMKTRQSLPGAPTVSVSSVSNPAKDFYRSRLGGFTQVQTSTAWCGNNVVVGYNDAGSILESYSASPREGLSLVGVARSTDKGATFTDLGYLKPSADKGDRIWGNASVKCTNANTFYYAAVLSRSHDSGVDDDTREIGVSKSSDGGATWANAVSAVIKSAKTHLLDKPSLALDPTNAKRLYIVYTDFDTEALSGTAAACPANTARTAIELVKSGNSGAAWGNPVVIAEVCVGSDSNARVDGPQVAVGPAGEVYVAWEAFADDYTTRQINIRKSTNAGAAFGDPVKVTDVTPVGSYDALQGMIQAREFPALAVDLRKGSKKVYIAWNDGRNLYATEAFNGDYKYRFSDVLLTSSVDGGATWLETPVRVNQNVESYASQGSDQFFPSLAVDKSGNLGTCFYDRRGDPGNLFIERYCAYSINAGQNWAEIKISTAKSPPLHDQDMLTAVQFIGEYDTLATDKLKLNKGFLGAFGDSGVRANWDIMAALLLY